jgi:apolipoprotein N-acyltransferase
VDPYGRTVVRTDLDGGAAEAQLPLELPPTLYSRLDNMLTLLVFFAVFLLYMAPSRKGAGAANQ